MPVIRISNRNAERLLAVSDVLKFEGYQRQQYAPKVTPNNALEAVLDEMTSYRILEKQFIDRSLQHEGAAFSLQRAPSNRGFEGVMRDVTERRPCRGAPDQRPHPRPERDVTVLQERGADLTTSRAQESVTKAELCAQNQRPKRFVTSNLGSAHKPLLHRARAAENKLLQKHRRALKVIEFFCGTKSLSRVFKARGHDTRTLDNSSRFYPYYKMDILKFDVSIFGGWIPDVAWFSSPCTGFSPASRDTHWSGSPGNYKPKTDVARKGMELAQKSMEIIGQLKGLNPKLLWFFENPTGVLRHLEILNAGHRQTVTYCSYGEPYMKLTDIWNNCAAWVPRKLCNSKTATHKHVEGGVQALKNKIERGRIPEQLCLEICKAAEQQRWW